MTLPTKAIEAGARAMESKRVELQNAPLARIYGDLAQACIEAAIASGELVPAGAVAAERKTTPDWGRLVQCVLRCMDATIKNESSREQAERIATAIEERFAMDSGAVAAERERCAKVAGRRWREWSSSYEKDGMGACLDIADAIRALSPEPASGEFVVVPRVRLERAIVWLKKYQADEHLDDDACEELDALINVASRELNAATKDGERK